MNNIMMVHALIHRERTLLVVLTEEFSHVTLGCIFQFMNDILS